jgi:hypothetical protein
MEELELELGIILGLASEIAGDESNGTPSLIKEKINFKSKVYLQRNLDAFLKVRETMQVSVNELIEKYGEEGEDGQIGVSRGSDKFLEFEKEYNSLISSKIKVNVTKIDLDDLNFSSESIYPLVVQFLIN